MASVKKSSEMSRNPGAFVKGDPRIQRGRGPKPGAPNAGRPPKAFKDFLAELRQNPKVQEALEKAATDHEARNFKAALDVIVRYDYDVPAEKIDHTHTLTDEQREKRVLDLVMQAKSRKERGLVS